MQQKPSNKMYPPVTQSRRASVKDLYSSQRTNRSSPSLSRGSGSSAVVSNPNRVAKIKRWDGNRRTTTVWDYLRRDPELWNPAGDCLVHLYEAGQSKRGASLRLSLADIKASNCKTFLRLYRPFPMPKVSSSTTSIPLADGELVESYSAPARYEIYVPAPSHLSREDAFRYHLTTRNFFAWMFHLPIVGSRLGESLIALLDRMNVYRPDKMQNRVDLLAFLDSQKYTDFRQCPDHSLAILQLAERYQIRDLWTDAFVHCTGMNDNLVLSGEFEATSSTSKVLIMRASLEMNVRLERAERSLEDFIEDDLSKAHLGVGNDARVHIERFRSFLHSYFVGKFGYWPPAPTRGNSAAVRISIYRSMYFEFRKLYEYLLDPLSSNSMHDNRPADGGLCVLQNVTAFDKRHKYVSLPHPLPLLPEIPVSMSKHKSSKRLKLFGNRQAKFDHRLEACAALSAATNSISLSVMECTLVREYLYFEKIWTTKAFETVTCAEARKARWILIYAILQTLISITQAPKEVRDTEGVSYPLCCQIAGTTPWKNGLKALRANEIREDSSTEALSKTIEIKPDVDCSGQEPVRSVVSPGPHHNPSLSRKMSTRHNMNVDAPQTLKTSACEILLTEYSKNVQSRAEVDSNPSTPSSSASGAGSEGWSSNSSDDGMEHLSVTGSMGNDGENGDETIDSFNCDETSRQ